MKLDTAAADTKWVAKWVAKWIAERMLARPCAYIANHGTTTTTARAAQPIGLKLGG